VTGAVSSASSGTAVFRASRRSVWLPTQVCSEKVDICPSSHASSPKEKNKKMKKNEVQDSLKYTPSFFNSISPLLLCFRQSEERGLPRQRAACFHSPLRSCSAAAAHECMNYKTKQHTSCCDLPGSAGSSGGSSIRCSCTSGSHRRCRASQGGPRQRTDANVNF
jgi:hypothetical protein